MCGFSRVLLLLLLASSCVLAGDMYDSKGRPHFGVSQRSRTPVEIVDTITVYGKYASMPLSNSPSVGPHDVSATSPFTIFATITQIVTDSTETLRYYGFAIKDNGKRILIIANNATDTTRVVVRAIAK